MGAFEVYMGAERETSHPCTCARLAGEKSAMGGVKGRSRLSFHSGVSPSYTFVRFLRMESFEGALLEASRQSVREPTDRGWWLLATKVVSLVMRNFGGKTPGFEIPVRQR